MGFNVFTCMAGRPETKAKVESPMRILDDIKAYNEDLTLKQLTKNSIYNEQRKHIIPSIIWLGTVGNVSKRKGLSKSLTSRILVK